MKQVEKMIKDFLELVEKDKALAEEKLKGMEQERTILDRDRSEISKAIIRFENDGDVEAVKKLDKELATKVQEIAVLDSKIEAYKEMGVNYESEAERIFECAAKTLVLEVPKAVDEQSKKVQEAKYEVEKAEELLKQKEEALKYEEGELYTIKWQTDVIANSRLKEIMPYMPEEIKNFRTQITGLQFEHDGKLYDNSLEGQLKYYYDLKNAGGQKPKEPKKKTIVDKVLGR